jgi:hypothetical protein
MEKKYVTEINCTTGDEVTREYTAEEYLQAEKDAQDFIRQEAEAKAEAQRISDLKESAKAKLISGQPLTSDEASVLVI